jgi:zinc transport system substrate-binding protein
MRTLALAWLPVLLLALILAACNRPPPAAPAAGAIRIVATIPPLHGLIAPLLDDAKLPHDLATLVPPGASEHGFELSPDKLAALGKADVVVMAGMGMEPQVEKFLADHPNPARRVVNLAEALKLAPATDPTAHDDHDHDHDHDHADHDHSDHDHDHDHHAGDPHTWLDPQFAKVSITAIAAALRPQLSEKGQLALTESRNRLADRIDAVDRAYSEALKNAPRRTIVVAHDAYSHLAKRYNLEVIPITGLNAGEARPADLQRAAQAIRDHHLTTIFIEPQLSSAAADRIAAATGAKTAILDPLGTGDWFDLMDKNLQALKQALGSTTAAPADTSTTPPKPPEKP